MARSDLMSDIVAPAAVDLSAPIILTGRGGSGTRLFSIALQKLEVFLGNRLNHTEDSVEWVEVIYGAAIDKLRSPPSSPVPSETFRRRAAAILAEAGGRRIGKWGWKLPETMLILPEVAAAFDNCRIIHAIRHPLDTCLRRSHMTSKPKNPIGDAVLAAAYARLGWARDPADDPEHLRNAASWLYQVGLAQDFFGDFPVDRSLTLRYESLCDQPADTMEKVAAFIGAGNRPIDLGVDHSRRRMWSDGDSRIEDVWRICGSVAQIYGYHIDGSVVTT